MDGRLAIFLFDYRRGRMTEDYLSHHGTIDSEIIKNTEKENSNEN